MTGILLDITFKTVGGPANIVCDIGELGTPELENEISSMIETVAEAKRHPRFMTEEDAKLLQNAVPPVVTIVTQIGTACKINPAWMTAPYSLNFVPVRRAVPTPDEFKRL